MDHGFIYSAYFNDPNGIKLEITCTRRGYGREEWRPEVLDRKLRDEENMAWDEDAAVRKAAEQQKMERAAARGGVSARSKL